MARSPPQNVFLWRTLTLSLLLLSLRFCCLLPVSVVQLICNVNECRLKSAILFPLKSYLPLCFKLLWWINKFLNSLAMDERKPSWDNSMSILNRKRLVKTWAKHLSLGDVSKHYNNYYYYYYCGFVLTSRISSTKSIVSWVRVFNMSNKKCHSFLSEVVPSIVL